MAQGDGNHFCAADIEFRRASVDIIYLGLDIGVFYWKVGRGHHSGKNRFHEFAVKRTAVHDQFGALEVERFEKRKAHYVIPMGVSENEVAGSPFFLHEAIAQSSDSGAGVDNDQIVAFCADFYAGRIPAVFQV
jgi:hypothetical protein